VATDRADGSANNLSSDYCRQLLKALKITTNGKITKSSSHRVKIFQTFLSIFNYFFQLNLVNLSLIAFAGV
jgi:hypothetical protein